jgi:hypothetical protein
MIRVRMLVLQDPLEITMPIPAQLVRVLEEFECQHLLCLISIVSRSPESTLSSKCWNSARSTQSRTSQKYDILRISNNPCNLFYTRLLRQGPTVLVFLGQLIGRCY